MINRLHWKNQIRYSTTTLVPSSEDPQFPASNLLDQLRQKPWRSQLGWTIVAGFNDRIDFSRSGAKVATVAPGTYATGALLAVAVAAALDAADPPAGSVDFDCDYGVAGAGLFRIRNVAGAPLSFVLNWGTGPNVGRSICRDLGFRGAGAAPADSASVNTINGTRTVYQSRHFITANVGATGASEGANAITIVGHNLSTEDSNNHEVLIQANTTDAWTAPNYSENDLTSEIGKDDTLRTMYVDPGTGIITELFWRLVIDDCQALAGFFELGVWFVGPYSEDGAQDLGFCCSDSLELTEVDYTVLQQGPSGASFATEEPRADTFALEWLDIEEPSVTDQILDAFNSENPVGRAFFFTFDTDDPEEMVYVHKTEGRRKSFVPVTYWTHHFVFREQL